jgi:hypothetical protein
MARPSSFTQEMADAICERLVDGDSLRAICRDPEMPAISTVCRWLAHNEEFQKQYACAREAQADTLADEILDIADDSTGDTINTENGEKPNNEWISRSRLRVDARKWLAGKMAPKKYGEKLIAEHTGKDGAAFEVVHRIQLVALNGDGEDSST